MKLWLTLRGMVIWMIIYQWCPNSDAAPAAPHTLPENARFTGNSNNENSTSLKAALDAVTRVRRDVRRPTPRGLVRYRYPLHIKRSYFNPSPDAAVNDYEPEPLMGDVRDQFGFRRHAQHLEPAERSSEAAFQSFNDYARTRQGRHEFRQLLGKLDEESWSALLRHLQQQKGTPEMTLSDEADPESLVADDEQDGESQEAENEAIAAILQELASEGLDSNDDDENLSEFMDERKRAMSRAPARWRARYVSEADQDQGGMLYPHGSSSEDDNGVNGQAGPSKGFHRNWAGFREQWKPAGKRWSNMHQYPHLEMKKRSVQRAQHEQNGQQRQQHTSHLSSAGETPSLQRPIRKRRQVEMEPPRALPVLAEAKVQINASKTVNSTGTSTHAPKKHRPISSLARRENSLKSKTKNIRKKSVDWDDYFGIDKRSDEDFRDWLESEYYKAIAGSLASRRKRFDQHSHDKVMKKRNSVPRHLDSDIGNQDRQDDVDLTEMEEGEDDEEGDEFEEETMKKWRGREEQQAGPTSEEVAWESSSLVDEGPDTNESDDGNDGDDGDAVLSRRRRRRQLNSPDRQRSEAHYMAELIDRMSLPQLQEMVADLKQRLQRHLANERDWEDYDEDNELREGFLPGKQWDDDEQNDQDEDEDDLKKKKKKRSLKKRYPFDVAKRAGMQQWLEQEPGFYSLDTHRSDEEECPVLRQILPVCHVVSQITGDYHNLFMDTCNRHQACLLCVDEDEETNACTWTFNEQSQAICQGDLICLSRARRMAQALRSLHEQDEEADLAKVACQRDACVARYLKKR